MTRATKRIPMRAARAKQRVRKAEKKRRIASGEGMQAKEAKRHQENKDESTKERSTRGDVTEGSERKKRKRLISRRRSDLETGKSATTTLQTGQSELQ